MWRHAWIVSFLALLMIAMFAATGRGQNQEGLLSPPEKAQCTFPNGKTVKVDYSSPRIRGRKIFGDLVPFGEVWRAGANEATTFVPNTDVIVGGTKVPARAYTLFALPTPSRWTLIIDKETDEWGIPYPGTNTDFARINMNVSKPPRPIENFTIGFDKAGNGCAMYMEWDTTRASVQVVPAS